MSTNLQGLNSELNIGIISYKYEILHSLHGTPSPLVIYCDASTDSHGATGIGGSIPDVDFK